MTITGAQLTARIFRRYPSLGMIGKTTTAGGDASANQQYLEDTIRQQRQKFNTQEYRDSEIRIYSGDSNNNGYVGEIVKLEPTTGRIYFFPTTNNAVSSGAVYGILQHGLRFDDMDAARDRALANKVSGWRLRPLSVIPGVESWSTAAYSSTAGGETNAAATLETMAFPWEYAEKSMVVTNSGADGYNASPSYYVQPGDQYVVFGGVSVRAQTAKVRVRRITSTAADITLDHEDEFTFRGPQHFNIGFTVPDGCNEIQIWLGGASASCIAEWAGVGLLPQDATMLTLPSRVRARTDVGGLYEKATQAEDDASGLQYDLAPLPRNVRQAAALVSIVKPRSSWGMYYEERHRYSALQSEYLAVSDRTTGDAATTDADIDYLAAATVVELLEGVKKSGPLNDVYGEALADLASWDDQIGPEEQVHEEFTRPGAPALPRL